MSDSQTQDVGDLVNPVEAETTQPIAQSTEEVSKEPSRGSQEYNFREMRKLIEEQSRKIRDLEDTRYQSSPHQQEEVDDLATLRKDDFLTVAQAEKLALRKAEELLHQREIATQEDQVRLRNSDYDQVVNEDNIKQLIEDDRDLVDTLKSAPNPYAAAYKLIKKSNFYNQREEMQKKKSMEAEKLLKNANKPQSSNAIQSKPLSEANSFIMNEAMRKEVAKEMYESAKRR